MGKFKVEPRNEMQVREWFAAHIEDYDYSIIISQKAFPDYVLEDANGKHIRTEVESLSENFIKHGHSPDGCDMVLCWRHTANIPLSVWELATDTFFDPGKGAEDWTFQKEGDSVRVNLAPYAQQCEKELDRFMDCFVTDLKARDEWHRLMREPRMKLNAAAIQLIRAIDDVGGREELKKVRQDTVPSIHPDDLFSYIHHE